MMEEASLRDKLIKNVQQLEQRRRELERQLYVRDSSTDSTSNHLHSAVVLPREHS